MFNMKKAAALLTAVALGGAYAFVLPSASAASATVAPAAELGVRITAESSAGKIAEGNLGSGIAKKNSSDKWTAVESIGEGTDGTMTSRYDMKTSDEITAQTEKNSTYTYTIELGYGQSKRFALIEEYTVPDLENAEELEFSYVSQKKSSDNIGIWLYDGEMPTTCSVNTVGEERANAIIQNLAKSYGIYSGNSTAADATVSDAEASEPLAKTSGGVEAGAAYTVTVTGDALKSIQDSAVYDDAGNGSFVITVNNANLVGNSTAKIYMKVKDAQSENDPSLSVKYAAKEVSDAPDGAVELKNAVSNSATSPKQFTTADGDYISAVTTTANNDIWYIGDYNTEDITEFAAKAIMCPGYTDGEISTTPSLNIAYSDVEEGVSVDADYITANSSAIRSAANKLASYSGYNVEASNSDNYDDFETLTIEITDNFAKVSGTKHLFVYGTANKARMYIDYVKVTAQTLAEYPEGAVGVYNDGAVTNYTGSFAKANVSDDTYRYVTSYKNDNGKIWYLGTYAPEDIESIDISAVMTAVQGQDGNTYAPSVKLAYMPLSDTAVDADYIETNSKTIRDAKKLIYTWSEATDGLVLKNVEAAELAAISDEEVELFVYGTTQVKYTYTNDSDEEITANAQPVLGLDYVKVNTEAPSEITLTASDDMQLRTGNTTDYRKTWSMETKANSDERYAFTGAVKFDISKIARYIASGYKVKSAVLRVTTMKRQNSNAVMAVPFTTDFGEDYAKSDVLGDELIDTVKYAIENYTSYSLGSLQSAMNGKNLNDYATMTDGTNTNTELSSWYNTVDISDYLGGAAKAGADELPILLYNASDADTTGNQICTKDLANDTARTQAWENISGFYTIDGNAVTAEDFAPALVIELEAGDETAEPVEVMTGRISTNKVVLSGGYDYMAWKCTKDVTDNGKTVAAGEPLYSVKRVMDDEANASLNLTADDFTLDTFYITGTDTVFEDGAENTKTNPYVDADGNVYKPQVSEYVNSIELSSDLVSDDAKVYLAAYDSNGVLEAVEAYDAAESIETALDENGEGFEIKSGSTLKVFVWQDGMQAPLYIK